MVLPTKRKIDAEYMAQATFTSDLKLIVDSVLRRWDASVANRLPEMERFPTKESVPEAELENVEPVSMRVGAG